MRAGVPESSVSAWVEGIREGEQTSLRLDGVDLPATYVGPPDATGARQINGMVPIGVEPGDYSLSARCGALESRPVAIQLVS